MPSSRTHAPVWPGVNPSTDPGPSGEQSTKLVSHGSERFMVMPSGIQRTEANRVSSMPSLLVGRVGSHLAAAATSAFCAVGQDTPTPRRHPRPPGCPTRSPSPPAAAAAQSPAPAARIVRTGGERSRPSLTKLARVGPNQASRVGPDQLVIPTWRATHAVPVINPAEADRAVGAWQPKHSYARVNFKG
jgi:hypothetical protein